MEEGRPGGRQSSKASVLWQRERWQVEGPKCLKKGRTMGTEMEEERKKIPRI